MTTLIMLACHGCQARTLVLLGSALIVGRRLSSRGKPAAMPSSSHARLRFSPPKCASLGSPGSDDTTGCNQTPPRCAPSRSMTIFTTLGNGILRLHIKHANEGMMKQSKFKKQPTRDDLAAALNTIRDQFQIINLQAKKIRYLELVMGHVLLAYPRLEELRVN
jgi:hypothetical protein